MPAAIAALLSSLLLGAAAVGGAGGLGAASASFDRFEPRLLGNPLVIVGGDAMQAISAVVDEFAGGVAMKDPRVFVEESLRAVERKDPRLLANPVIVMRDEAFQLPHVDARLLGCPTCANDE